MDCKNNEHFPVFHIVRSTAATRFERLIFMPPHHSSETSHLILVTCHTLCPLNSDSPSPVCWKLPCHCTQFNSISLKWFIFPYIFPFVSPVPFIRPLSFRTAENSSHHGSEYFSSDKSNERTKSFPLFTLRFFFCFHFPSNIFHCFSALFHFLPSLVHSSLEKDVTFRRGGAIPFAPGWSIGSPG